MKKILSNVLLFLFLAIVMAFSVRGLAGNPTAKELQSSVWKDDGPMELSPERGRYALLYSLAENHSLSFSLDLAKFSTPDVAYQNGHYVSLFAPGVSFLAVPGYLVGKFFGLAQVGAFAMIALFAIVNAFLIRAIAIRLGAHPLAGTIGGVGFLFASPAFAYAVSLYQHHISTFLILAAVWLLMGKKDSQGSKSLGKVGDVREVRKAGGGFWSLAAIWVLFALSIPVDYPNAFLMLPIAAAALAKTIMVYRKPGEFTINVSLLRAMAVSAVIIPLLFFGWFNTLSYGNPTQLSGTLERVLDIKKDKPVFEHDVVVAQLKKDNKYDAANEGKKSALGFFQNRTMLNGAYEHLFSLDRGMVVFTPLMLLGILGIILAFYKKMPYVALLVAIMGFDLILYSMWEDPYGGWAFGSRYLIPTYAILSVFIALALTKYARYNLLLLMFFILFAYSTGVNTLGAVTTNRNPPKVEIQSLEKQTHQHEDYTYMRNVAKLDTNEVKSFVFEAYAGNKVSAWTYYMGLVVFIVSVMAGMIVTLKYQISNIKYQISNARPKTGVSGRRREVYVKR